MSRELERAIEMDQYENMEYMDDDLGYICRDIDLAYQASFAEIYDY